MGIPCLADPKTGTDLVQLPGARAIHIHVWNVGPSGQIAGMETLRASAPLKELQREFGLDRTEWCVRERNAGPVVSHEC